jgi:sorbitol-specific phosphotransferase system component IIBC
LVILPVALSIALLLRYSQRVPSYSIKIAIVGCGGALIVGIFAVHSIGTIRKRIKFGQMVNPKTNDEDEDAADSSI